MNRGKAMKPSPTQRATSNLKMLRAEEIISFLQVILLSVINTYNTVIILNYYRDNRNEIICRRA